MKRALSVLIAALSFGAAYGAETGKVPGEHWQATNKSMTDLLSEGFRLVSVVAPNSQLRVFFLSKHGEVAKCSEEAALNNLPPHPGEKGVPNFDPREFVPDMVTKFECSKLVKAKR